MDAEFASSTNFQRRVVHGMLVASYVSTMIGMHLPGPGALWTQQNFQWAAPVFISDQLDFVLRVTHRSDATRTVKIEVKVTNQNGKTVMAGEGCRRCCSSPRRVVQAETALSERVALISVVSIEGDRSGDGSRARETRRCGRRGLSAVSAGGSGRVVSCHHGRLAAGRLRFKLQRCRCRRRGESDSSGSRPVRQACGCSS